MTRVPLFSPPRLPAPAPPPDRSLPPVEAVRTSADVAADVVRLAELQAKLFAADWRAASGRAVGGAVLLVAGVLAAVLCVPVLVAALGLGLAALGLPVWAGLLIAGVLAVGAGAVAAWRGWRRLAGAARAFDRSRAAAAENAAWVKRSLARQPHPPASGSAPNGTAFAPSGSAGGSPGPPHSPPAGRPR